MDRTPEVVENVYYLSGPMTGYPEYNYPEFERVKKILEKQGYRIESPHECEPEPEGTPENELWEKMMLKCMKKMENCTAIILMEGWPESRGARRELEYAIHHGWPVFYFNPMTHIATRMSRYVKYE